jgi:alkaline phosphatase
VSHATPAALYAHSADRYWECNKKKVDGSLDETDISWQLVHTNPGMRAKVALGGGRSSFLPKNPSLEDEAWYLIFCALGAFTLSRFC